MRSLEGDPVSEIYSDYIAAFEDVSKHSPIAWVLDEDRFVEIMKEPEFLKIVHFDRGGDIDNMFVVGNVDEFEWVDANRLTDYLSYRFGEGYADNPVISCPFIYSRVGASKTLSLQTFGLLAQANDAADVRPITFIECIGANTDDVTSLFEYATARAGVSTITVGEPVVRQSVQVLTVG